MILHSVHVENYKGIRGPLNVDFDADSPNLLEGPNGAGKSTLVEAIQQCLLESHNTTGVSAEEMRPRETALTPFISVVFGHGGGTYRISKTYLDSCNALLERRRADGSYDTIAKGKAADEGVREMLRSQPTKAKEKPGERLGLLSILCNAQGKQDLPALSGDALADIRRMLGAQVSGTRGAAFERLVSKKYLAVWTPGGKPKKGKLSDTKAALALARQDLEKCVERMTQVSTLESSARDQRSRSKEGTARLRRAEAEYDPLATIEQLILELRASRIPAASHADAVSARYNQMRAEIDRIIDASNKKRLCQEIQLPLKEAEDAARTLRDARIQEATAKRNAWELTCQPNSQLQQMEQKIGRAETLLQLGKELDALQARMESIGRAAERRAVLENQIAALKAPDRSAWKSIQGAGHDFDIAKLRVEALALRLEILAEGDLTANVIAGDPAGESRLLRGQTLIAHGNGLITVSFPGFAMLQFSGPSGDTAQWQDKLQSAGNLVERLLEPYGVSTWQELMDRVHQRDDLWDELVGVQADYAATLGADSLADLQEFQRDKVSKHDEILQVEPSWAQQVPDLEAMRKEAGELKRDWESGQNQARTEWQTAEAARAESEGLWAAAAEARSANEASFAIARHDLEALEANGLTMTEREQQLAAKRRECESADDALTRIDAELAALPADTPERAAALRGQIEALGSEIQEAREAYQQDEAAVRAILLQGPYTSLATTEERVSQLQDDEAAEQLRLDAIRRLKTAVDDGKAKVLAGIAQPVEARATALLERIAGLPLARIDLGEGMALQTVQPEGCSGNCTVEQMSAGEQEQIYFVTRLALAEVLCEQERQVVVLDDPLVNTDADRMVRVLNLIKEESKHLQFVILTCHPGRYLEFPDVALQHMNELELPVPAVTTKAQS